MMELDDEQRKKVMDLKAKNEIIGDYLYQLIDPDGNIKAYPGLYKFCGLPLSHLKEMVRDEKRVVVLATAEKKDVVAAALKGRLFNCLICDEETAEYLLKA